MRRHLRNCTLILLALLAGQGSADTQTYDTALDQLEASVDQYFHAILRSEVGATDAQLTAFEDALRIKIASDFTAGPFNVLTKREQIIHLKMIVLRQLHPEFTNNALPANLESAFANWEATRMGAIADLRNRGEL